jgi:hypothetical protein
MQGEADAEYGGSRRVGGCCNSVRVVALGVPLSPDCTFLQWLSGDGFSGIVGRLLGAFNAIVSSLGFAAVIATLIIQARSLASQQTDQHRQRFEHTFFQLLTLMRELRGEVTYRYSSGYRADAGVKATTTTLKGVSAIAGALKELDHWRRWTEVKPLSKKEMAEMYEQRVHTRFERHFGPYFRIVYTMLNRIRNDKLLTPDEKVLFANLFRSQLTSDEIELAAFNALMPAANDLSALLTEFKMLKYLPNAKMREVLARYYLPAAFEGRDDPA